MPNSTSALLARFDTISAAAVIAAHANSPTTEFRQRDVRFLIELFSNWVEHSIGIPVGGLQNTQISRYLEQLCDDGLCSKSVSGNLPQYRLQRIGVIELLGRVTHIPNHVQAELGFFACYFIYNYRERLWALVDQEGKRFPLALRIELESLLDYSTLLSKLIAQAEIELRKLKVRISDAKQASTLAIELQAKGHTAQEIAQAIEKEYPYELNSQKPLSELISALHEPHGLWELGDGTRRRSIDLWQPSKIMLEAYLGALKDLLAKNNHADC